MKRITLKAGETYRNNNGQNYKCIGYEKNGRFNGCAIVKSEGGWVCTVSSVYLLDNGRIEWSGSYNGHFEEVTQ